MVSRISYLFALLAGSGLVLSFAPFYYYPLSFISLAVLFFLCAKSSAKQGFWLSTLFGLGVYLAGVSWVYVSLKVYGGMPIWMGFIAVVLFALVMSLFISVPMYLLLRVLSRPCYRLYCMPMAWVLGEWSKSWVLTGFPWLDIGYSQTETWLSAWAPVGGVYLVSLLVAMVAVLLVSIVYNLKKAQLAIIGVLCIVVSSYFLDNLTWSVNQGNPLKVAVVQANVDVNKKWRYGYYNTLIKRYQGLMSPYSQTDLFVLPETAIPLYRQQASTEFWQSLAPNKSALLTGLVDRPEATKSYNAALLVCADKSMQLYRKRHLVPFGEYLPFRSLLSWLLDYLHIPMSDFSAWQGVQNLQCPDNIHIGLSICYEDAFANELRSFVGEASLLVNISEDAWFGDSLAPHQRLQMAQMRAKELARPLLRSANTGPSAIIDERGEVVHQSGQFTTQVLSATVQPKTGQTLFAKWGNWVVYLCFILLCFVGLFSRRF